MSRKFFWFNEKSSSLKVQILQQWRNLSSSVSYTRFWGCSNKLFSLSYNIWCASLCALGFVVCFLPYPGNYNNYMLFLKLLLSLAVDMKEKINMPIAFQILKLVHDKFFQGADTLRCVLRHTFKCKVLTLGDLSSWMQGERWAAIVDTGEMIERLLSLQFLTKASITLHKLAHGWTTNYS